MKRKIIKLADTTYVVSLPLKWAKKHNIKKGDEVEVNTKNSTLTVNLKPQTEQVKKYEVNIQENNVTGYRYISSLYRLGYDEYRISFDQPSFMDKVPEGISQNTIGLAIIKQSENACIIKDLSEKKPDQLNPIIRRLWLLVLDMANDISKAFQDKDLQMLENMPAREKNVNQFMNYSLRLISAEASNLKNPFSLYYLIRQLESIADTYRDMAISHVKSRSSMNKATQKKLITLNQLFRRFYECYYNYSIEVLDELLMNSRNLCEQISNISAKTTEIEVYIDLIHIYTISKKINELCSLLIELNI